MASGPLRVAGALAAAVGAACVSGVRDWLRTLSEDEAAEDAEIGILDEMDELREQRVERRNSVWFPRGGGAELARLAAERRRRTRRGSPPSG